MVISVSSCDDPRVSVYRNLKDRDVAGRGEYFILEGENSIQNLVNHNRIPLVSVCISQRRITPMAPLLSALDEANVPVYALEQEALEKVVGYHFHRGVLGCGRRLPRRTASELLCREARGEGPIIIGENVTNLDNVGAIFRNAAAFGAQAVIFDDKSSDPYYRKSIRVSGGHALVVPFTHGTSSSEECIRAAQSSGFKVLALVTPHSEHHSDVNNPLSIVDWRRDHPRDKVAILLGAEGPGLSAQAAAAADAVVSIPIVAHVDSLNVATACAVALHAIHTPPQMTNLRRRRSRRLALIIGGGGLLVLLAFSSRRLNRR